MNSLRHAPTGVLAVNLGSPGAPDAAALRAYLAEFLSDPLVVDWPRWLWLPILHGIILRTRPARSAALYQRVWTPQGAPLVSICRAQAALLQQALGPGFHVVSAMRYGRPSLHEGLDALQAAGCERFVLLPLFPQYAAATRGSVERAVESLLAKRPGAPRCLRVPPYPADEGYLEALVATIRETLARHTDVEHIVFSFHGIPERVVRRGDPYREHCETTAMALALRLELPASRWSLVYQSRFGPERWLQPYASEFVPALAPRVRRVLVCCPGFTADCLETTDEIGRELAHRFRAAGGEQLVLVPCLNTHPTWIAALADLVRRAAPDEAR